MAFEEHVGIYVPLDLCSIVPTDCSRAPVTSVYRLIAARKATRKTRNTCRRIKCESMSTHTFNASTL